MFDEKTDATYYPDPPFVLSGGSSSATFDVELVFENENTFTLFGSKYYRSPSEVTTIEVRKQIADAQPATPETQPTTPNTQSTDYAYLAASDFRSIRNQYSNATPRCAYVVAFTDKNGDNCVLVDLYWKIINNYHDVILHNLATGRVINDPVTYYGNMANRQYGASKLHYMDLQLEVLEHLADATGKGTFISGEALSQ